MPSVRSIKSCLSGSRPGVVPQQGLEELFSALWGQRVKPELGVVGLAAPGVLVLRAIIDEQEEAGRRQALDQAIEQRLCLRIDPVQVLEHQQQRLHLTLAQQDALERLEGALAPLQWIELEEWAVLRQGLQEHQQRWDGVMKTLVQRQHLPGHLGPHRPRIIAAIDLDNSSSAGR